jgi:phage shock protein PspC (stress-responsive transcriptional regulator)
MKIVVTVIISRSSKNTESAVVRGIANVYQNKLTIVKILMYLHTT